MVRRPQKRRAGAHSSFYHCLDREQLRPYIEPLEARLMLDGGIGSPNQLPSGIVVGRTLSSYTVPGIQGDALTITYTVYNEQADPINGILLVDTLQPGVAFESASVLPDRNGQELAWSLGTLDPFGRASVQLTVSLANPVPLQLDSGARAFGSSNARAVSDATAPAVLRVGAVPPELLASTPDANTTDPFVQEKAAALDYDPQRIFDFLRTEVGYESYRGSLRGARGTLWSGAGDALDEASLGVALFRASGIPARYVQGTLTVGLAQQLILSMFPPSFQTAGFIPAGAAVADPVNDPKLLAEAREHYWVQFDTGNGLQDADTAFAAAQIGQTFTSAQGTFAEVPDGLRHRTTVRLNAEITNLATGLFGLPGQQVTTVLNQTFNDVDLVGRPLSFGHLVHTSSISSLIFAAVTNTYAPYLAVGDEAFDASVDRIIRGQDYQEVLTNFPFGSQILTGLVLQVEMSGPDGPTEQFERTLVDRIGFAARQGGGSSSLGVDPSGPPILSNFDVFTLHVLPGLQDPSVAVRLNGLFQAALQQIRGLEQPDGSYPPAALPLLQARVLDHTRLIGINFLAASDAMSVALASGYVVRAYFDRPRLVLVSNRVETPLGSPTSTVRLAIDLRRDSIRVVVAPGQDSLAAQAFHMARGVIESELEARIVASGSQGSPGPVSTASVFDAAIAQGVDFLLIAQENLALLGTLDISAEAQARITAAAGRGSVVYMPARSVVVNGTRTTAWYEINPATGETIGVTEDGGHQGIVEYASLTGLLQAGTVAVANVINQLLARLGVPMGNQINSQNIKEILNKYAIGFAIGAIVTFFFINPVVGIIAYFVGLFFAVLAVVDPPLPNLQVGLQTPPIEAINVTSADVPQPARTQAGTTSGQVQAASVTVSNQVTASWSTSTTSAFLAGSLIADQATVRGPGGAIVGSGVVSLSALGAVPVAVSGDVRYRVNGRGRLSFYAPATSGLGVSGEWEDFTADLSGDVTLSLTTDVLLLNNSPLPAGSYTITASSANLTGSGPSTSPVFSGSVSINATDGTVELGPGTGDLTVAGAALDPGQGVTLSGFDGSITIMAGASTDAVVLQGTAAAVLRVAGNLPVIATDQNTPGSFAFAVQTSFAGTYALTARAPDGWTVALDDGGVVTVTPAPGLQGGTFPILLTARSQARPELVAQGEVMVTVTPTQPGIILAIEPDPLFTVPAPSFTVPATGALLPSAFRAEIRNLGPIADTFDLTFPTLPAGFVVLNSGSRVTVPAGETAVVGLYLAPSGQLPPPGTTASFTVTATSTATAAITATEAESFVVPEVHGLTIVSDPQVLNTTPGVPATATLTLQAVGNVPESVALAASLPAGLSASSPAPVVLGIGESRTFTIALTPAAATPLHSRLTAAITATFGPSGSPLAQTVSIPVQVAVPGADAIADAAIAANQLGDANLAARLNDLSVALTNLVQTPTSDVFKGQALASLGSTLSLLAVDPILSTFVVDLRAGRDQLSAAVSAAEVQAAVSTLGGALDQFGEAVAILARSNFEVFLLPNSQVAQPGTPATFEVRLHNIGTDTTTYDLTLAGLPAGVTGNLSQNAVTLARDEFSSGILVTLTPPATEVFPFDFQVIVSVAGAPQVSKAAAGSFTARDEFVAVVAVTTDPPFVDPGGSVNISARLLNAVNRQRSAMASFVVRDPIGQQVFASTPVPADLTVQTSLTTVALGTLDTTGLALGSYTIDVTLTDAGGQLIPGATGRGALLVGSPVGATLSVGPDLLPPGSGTITNTLVVASQTPLVGPLGVLSQTDLPGAGGVARNGQYVYASGSAGITVYKITDPSHPQSIRTFGSSATTLEIRGDRLYTLTFGGPFGRFSLMIYSLTDPESPQFLGNAQFNNIDGIPYSLAWNMVVTDTHVFVSLWSTTFLVGGQNDIKFQTGDVIAFDVTDPTAPTVVSVLRNTYGTNDDGIGRFLNVDNSGGDGNLWEIVAADDNTLLVAGSTAAGDDTQTGNGVVHVIDVSDPAHMAIVRTVVIPGTVQAVGLSIQEDRAFVVASQGGWSDPSPANDLTGDLVLATLDITDPRDPSLLHSEVLDRPSAGPFSMRTTPLGNGLIAFSSSGGSQDQPAIYVVDASDPSRLVTSRTTIPAATANLDGAGNFLYTTSASGLIIYQIDAPDAVPATARVEVPNNTGVSIVPGSFSLEPTRVIPGTDFNTYEWDLSLSAGDLTRTITWRSTVSNLQPGEAREVTLGSTVDFTSQGTPGRITLPSEVVAVEQILALDPATRTVRPGEAASYTLTLKNPTATAVTYSLSVQGVPALWVDLISSVTVAAQGTTSVPVTLTSGAFDPLGDFEFVITATAPTGATGSVRGGLTLQGAPLVPTADPEAHGVVAALIPAQATAGRGTTASFVVRVVNTGSITGTYVMAASMPPGVSGVFGQTTVDVPPGAGNFRDVTLLLTPQAGAILGALGFTVTATAGSVADTAAGTLTVVANGVDVDLNPPTSAPGGLFQLTVTNTGTVADTFDLALAGPGALVAGLGMSQVTLEPGASQVVPITTGAIDFALPGALNLTAIATSRGNAAVRDADAAALAVATTTGLATRFDPAVKLLPVPGTTSFLLIVENTGNTEDAYTAVIMGTSGPVTASLRDLNGQPAQALPLFRLPGLATGAVLIDTNLAAFGQGTVTVQVRSLSDGAITATATAMVTAQQVTAATTTQLQAAPNPALVGQPVTVTAAVTVPGGGVPTGTVTFTIDGIAQAPVPLQILNAQAQASLIASGLSAGQHTVIATYSGDAAFASSVSDPVTVTVAVPTVPLATTTTQLIVAPNPVTVGQPFTFTAIVTAGGVARGAVTAQGVGVPGGTVTFTVDGFARPPVPVLDLNGQAQASHLVADLSAGEHTVVATYSGDATFASSVSNTVTVTVSPPPVPLATATQLLAAPNPAVVGLAVTFTAVITAPSGGTPSGAVTFMIDGTPSPSVPLAVINGLARATLTTASLAAGLHTVTASYDGGSGFAPSASAPVVVAVNPAPAVIGPTITAVQRFGFHAQPTALVLTFSEDLERTSAEDPTNYTVIAPGHDGRFGTRDDRAIGIRSAVYNPTTRTVTLSPRRRLNVHRRFRLIVGGTTPRGVSGLAGDLLDGDRDGRPGGDFVTSITRRLLAGPVQPARQARHGEPSGAGGR
jgi:uncharacterized membrane protein